MKRIFWFLPVLAIVGALLVNYVYSTATLARIAHLGNVDYPALASSRALINDQGALEEAFKNAVSTADKNSLQQAAGKAETFNHDLQAFAAPPGMSEAATDLAHDFGGYYGAADSAASIMLGVKQGDVSTAAPEMQSRQQALSAKLKANKEHLAADFDTVLHSSQDNVRSSLVANTVAAIVILLISLAVSRASVSGVLRQLAAHPSAPSRSCSASPMAILPRTCTRSPTTRAACSSR